MTLVFSGFPDSLVLAKKRLEMFLPDLATEKFGSKWPKTTLGAVGDGCEGLYLSELGRLRETCLEFSQKISAVESMLPVKSLSCVAYECRGLEKLKDRVDVELSDPKKTGDNLSTEEMNRVDGVVGEWERLEEYLPKVNVPGSRIGSYRESKEGSTCVAFLDVPDKLHSILVDFKMAVDSAFPGRYSWMAESSSIAPSDLLTANEQNGGKDPHLYFSQISFFFPSRSVTPRHRFQLSLPINCRFQ